MGKGRKIEASARIALSSEPYLSTRVPRIGEPCLLIGEGGGNMRIRRAAFACIVVGLSAALLMSCGGGGYGGGGSPPSAMVAGLWSGNGCCVLLDPFGVTGITSDSGDDRFLLLGTHYVGKVGAAQTAYATCNSCLAGLLETDSYAFKLLAITPRVAVRGSIYAPNLGTPTTVSFTVPYDQSFERPSATATVQGVYTTNLGTGYTLAIAIDATGQVTGNDTNGCNLAGNVSTSHPAVDYYDVVLDVSTCGNSNGRYNGNAALIFDSTGRATALFLSASNANAAIGWLLSR